MLARFYVLHDYVGRDLRLLGRPVRGHELRGVPVSRILLPCLLGLGCAGQGYQPIAPIDPKSDVLTLGTVEHVGSKTRRDVSFHFDLDLAAVGQAGSARRHVFGSGKSARIEEALEVSQDRVTKLRATYDVGGNFIDYEGDARSRYVDPASGHSYVIAPGNVADASPTITREDGIATQKEIDSVKGDFGWVGKALPVQTKTFQPGEQVSHDFMPLIEREASKFGVTVDTASAVYRGTHGAEAVFDVEAKFSKASALATGTVGVSYTLRGQLGRAPDGTSGEQRGAGTMSLRIDGKGFQLDVSGTFDAMGSFGPA